MTFTFAGLGYYVTADGRKALVGAHAGELAGCVFGSLDGRTGPWVDPPAAAEPIERWLLIRPDNRETMFAHAYAVHQAAMAIPDARIVRLTDQPDADAELLKAAEAVMRVYDDDQFAIHEPAFDALRAAVKRVGGR